MANISAELAAIMAAILGEQVRGSIHDAIGKINDVSEHIFSTGSTDPTGNAIYSDLLYLNDTTWDLFKSNSTSPYAWSKIGNLEGNKITSITGPVTDPSTPLVDTYTINFSKIGPVTFNVTNGKGIVSITGPTSIGLIDTYTILYNDGSTTTFDVNNGKGIDSITGPVSAGLIDTYTINYNDGTTQTYVVTNGNDGNDGVSVTGVSLISKVGLLATYRMSFSNGTYFDYTVSDGASGSGTGDMIKAVYDTDNDGIVDAAKTLNGLTATIADLNKTSNLKTVATSGSYNDLNNKPTIPTVDQAYSATSINAQSGKAVAQALARYQPEVYFEKTDNLINYQFTDDAITENSTINVYSNIVGDKYTNISVSGHTCTVTMAVAQARTLTIYVK